MVQLHKKQFYSPANDYERFDVVPLPSSAISIDMYTVGDLITDINYMGTGFGKITILMPSSMCPGLLNNIATLNHEYGYVFGPCWLTAKIPYTHVISKIEAIEHPGTSQRDYYVVIESKHNQSAEPDTIHIGGEENGTEGNIEADSTV